MLVHLSVCSCDSTEPEERRRAARGDQAVLRQVGLRARTPTDAGRRGKLLRARTQVRNKRTREGSTSTPSFDLRNKTTDFHYPVTTKRMF